VQSSGIFLTIPVSFRPDFPGGREEEFTNCSYRTMLGTTASDLRGSAMGAYISLVFF